MYVQIGRIVHKEGNVLQILKSPPFVVGSLQIITSYELGDLFFALGLLLFDLSPHLLLINYIGPNIQANLDFFIVRPEVDFRL